MDITILCAVLITGASVLAIPIQMVRHLRADLEKKLECGEKKFDKIVDELEKINNGVQKCQIESASLNMKVTTLMDIKK